MAQTRKRTSGKSGRARTARAGGKRAEAERAPEPGVCPVAFCPVGALLTVAGEARPEAVQHLVNAGRELVLAAAAVLGARVDALQPKPRMERIEVE